MINILHIPFGYFPDTVGGTEIYVADLCAALRMSGEVMSMIVAPALQASDSEHDAFAVYRFSVAEVTDGESMFGLGEAGAAESLLSIVRRVKPQIVHFHAFSNGVGLRAARLIRETGVKMIYTYHTPTATCSRGTLLRWGVNHCDGEMRPLRCTACMLHGLGLPKAAACAVTAASAVLSWLPLRGGVKVRPVPLIWHRSKSVKEWFACMDRVVALGVWGRELLLRNGVPVEKLRVVRHGVPVCVSRGAVRHEDGVLKLAFFGRADRTKGLDVLLEALALLSEAKLELCVYALMPGDGDAFARHLTALCRDDARVRLLPPVPRTEVMKVMAEADAVVVPSLWFETGPLVVLEAFSAGVPVIGSGWGGIAEWVEDERDGLLVEAPTAEAWVAVLKRVLNEAGLLGRLRSGVRPPRTTGDVASEMLEIYKELL